MNRILTVIIVLLLVVGVGCGADKNTDDVEDNVNQINDNIRWAEQKTMIVPMTKDVYSGIRQSVSKGMPENGSGYDMTYVDITCNGDTIKLVPNQIQLIVLPANQTTPYHWSELMVDDESIVRVQFDEYISDESPEAMAGVGGHRVYEIEALSSGETGLRTVQTHVADGEDMVEEFTLNVIVGK